MPAIGIVKRQPNWRADGRALTPTAVGFLVPLLLVILCAPFACVFFARRRRQGRPLDYVVHLRTPVQRKAEARAKLATVTEIASVAGGGDGGSAKEKDRAAERKSIFERECAICLSTLYAPSPPEPAKTTGAPLASKTPSISDSSVSEEREEILRLNVCGHEYHIECLLSWFLVRKYSCPICRAVYFSTKKTEQPAAQGDEPRQAQDHTSESASHGPTESANDNTITTNTTHNTTMETSGNTNHTTGTEPRRETA